MYKVIVFDLDLTLWWCENTWIDRSSGSPFTRVSTDVLVDRGGGRLELFEDSRRALDALIAKGYTLTVASRSKTPLWAQEALEKLELTTYFSEIQIFPGSKIAHFEIIKEQTGCGYPEMLFFDDEQRNIDDMTGVGVECVHVHNGIEYSHIDELL